MRKTIRCFTLKPQIHATPSPNQRPEIWFNGYPMFCETIMALVPPNPAETSSWLPAVETP